MRKEGHDGIEPFFTPVFIEHAPSARKGFSAAALLPRAA
jgi:hypothetical protein